MPIIDKDGSLITWKVLEQIEFGGVGFDVVLGSDRSYYAVSEEEPIFCLQARTRREATQIGKRAIESYHNMLIMEEKRNSTVH